MSQSFREREFLRHLPMRPHDYRFARSLREAGIVDIRRAENRGEWWMTVLIGTICGGIILWAVMHV